MNMIGLLLVLVLILAAMVGLAVYVVTLCLAFRHRIRVQSKRGSGIFIPESWEEKTRDKDLYQQMQIEQQWLFSQLFSKGHDDSQSNDLFDPPTDWWE